MVRIINIQKNGNEFAGMISKKELYAAFITDDMEIIYKETYDKKNYRDYNHFTGSIGKFNPYIFFLEKPIQIEKLNRKEIIIAWDKIEEMNRRK